MNKLIRTKLKEKILKDHPSSHFEVLSKDELKKSLKAKLLEEAEEFVKSDKHIGETEELADVLEVLEALFELDYFNKEDIYKLKEEKFKRNGGFTEGLLWKD